MTKSKLPTPTEITNIMLDGFGVCPGSNSEEKFIKLFEKVARKIYRRMRRHK